MTFDEQYPNIVWMVENGRVEIGREPYSDSFIRVIDEGGLVWESDKTYKTIADALADAEAAIENWSNEIGL